MNVELALRYDPVVKLFHQRRVTRVLEVGSGVNGISDFFAGQVIGVDVNFSRLDGVKNPNITHQVGSIAKIPVKSNSFNYVVCIDTLEHLSKGEHHQALQELWRVTKSGGTLIIGFPSGSLSLQAERIINDLFRLIQKKDHPWLAEHLIHGLPDSATVVRELKKLGCKKITITGNVNLLIWLLVHLIFTLLDGRINPARLDFLAWPLFNLGKFLSVGPYYRQMLWIEK